MRRAFLPLATLSVAVLVAASCESPTDPDNATVLHAFELIEVNAQTLPETAYLVDNSQVWMLDELIEIRDDDRAKLTARTVEVVMVPPPGTPFSMPERTRSRRRPVTITGDSVHIYLNSDCSTVGCALDARGTLIGDEMLLLRPEWSNYKIFRYTRVAATP